MDLLNQALRGARQEGPAPHAAPGAGVVAPARWLVAGAGGALGSAVLAECLVQGRARSVAALVEAPLATTMRGLVAVRPEQLATAQDLCDLALVVLERERLANGRDDAFFRPDPEAWLPLAAALHRAGARRLVLLLPHAPAMLPQALRHGLASRDEAELAALGFEQLLIVRAAQPGEEAARQTLGLAQRLARLWWQQMRFMVPANEQPLTTAALARCVVRLAMRLPRAPAGRTHVLAPELLWQAHQDATQGAGHHRRSATAAAADPAVVAGRFDAWADAFLGAGGASG